MHFQRTLKVAYLRFARNIFFQVLPEAFNLFKKEQEIEISLDQLHLTPEAVSMRCSRKILTSVPLMSEATKIHLKCTQNS